MRLIDAVALKKKAQMRGHVSKKEMVTAYQMCVSTHDINEAPTVDAEPVRHGRWIKDGDFLICLNCESEINIRNSLGTENNKNYCPNCGAKMDEVK